MNTLKINALKLVFLYYSKSIFYISYFIFSILLVNFFRFACQFTSGGNLMEHTYFITITGLEHYYGKKPFEIGRIFKIVKEPDNEHDHEAIAVLLPHVNKVGYVANSPNTVYKGTLSAGRLYDKIDSYAYAQILFITHSSCIAIVLEKDEVEENSEE